MKNETNTEGKNNQRKWNKELLYSVIFFISSINIMSGKGLVDQILSMPLSLDTNYRLMKLGIDLSYLSSEICIDVEMAIIFLLFFLSVYTGIQSMKKAPTYGKRRIFDIVPQSIPGWLAFTQTFISALLIILLAIGFFLFSPYK